ncbi:hypothetical protein EVAR_9285_1 [Eumeta japonica]|uniref:Uncharacterized protein n=1 Tax=Eumeta variegata TaxID=151549 RepID=A0A4C1TNT3_EUMVA|nr:hypothetical protein EVAR_9285_1 [Eumeta japonica]
MNVGADPPNSIQLIKLKTNKSRYAEVEGGGGAGAGARVSRPRCTDLCGPAGGTNCPPFVPPRARIYLRLRGFLSSRARGAREHINYPDDRLQPYRYLCLNRL